MRDDDLPPHLRETDLNRRGPARELPLELPDASELPAPPPEQKDERPVDPFLRTN